MANPEELVELHLKHHEPDVCWLDPKIVDILAAPPAFERRKQQWHRRDSELLSRSLVISIFPAVSVRRSSRLRTAAVSEAGSVSH